MEFTSANNVGRWSSDYLTHLNSFKKCHHPQLSIAVGNIVLVKDADIFVHSWPLARVIQTHPGDDRLVRVVTVRHISERIEEPFTS